VELSENHGIKPIVGIVGTRHPTEHGLRWTSLISATLAKSGFTVISGMAAGIDGEAHQACLEAGGRTIAVLGTGVDIIYPAHHRQLYEQIQQQGLILSEYPAGTRADRRNFPPRNRIIAGLSRAVLVMEAPHKSGSLITARFANEFGRDIYALPNSPENQQAEGCLRLLRDGAEIIIEIGELLTMLGAIPELDAANQQLSLFANPSLSPPPSQAKISQILELEPDLDQVWQVTKTEATPFDAIVQDSGLEASTVSVALLQLELMGLVSQLPGMRYQRC
jgi:DNA processing protein